MQPYVYFKWDISQLAEAHSISFLEAEETLRDGRKIGFILEYKARYLIEGGRRSKEYAGWDIETSDGSHHEVRGITKYGISFASSKNIGTGRAFNEGDFLDKLESVKSFILVDVTRNSIDGVKSAPVFLIDKWTVLKWWEDGDLGPIAKISYKKIIKLLEKV